ncbi:hypothetical protein L227DRAFT_154206 [Lentinus tigrinus ALCF2SS1-6]|uniref:Uncharacterized protein n=1 Tax=Lentinus tigrinus ALCF2SS1-6 TaxID=1328759 RepID=A0A5C2S8M5_9APHY|nr:hypothetical protein L227DRAFT_154206 [Lentinus tigrinus ALCF2SS1-6]
MQLAEHDDRPCPRRLPLHSSSPVRVQFDLHTNNDSTLHNPARASRAARARGHCITSGRLFLLCRLMVHTCKNKKPLAHTVLSLDADLPREPSAAAFVASRKLPSRNYIWQHDRPQRCIWPPTFRPVLSSAVPPAQERGNPGPCGRDHQRGGRARFCAYTGLNNLNLAGSQDARLNPRKAP